MSFSWSKVGAMLVNGTLAVCAVVTTTLVVRSTMLAETVRPGQSERRAPPVEDWAPLFTAGQRWGRATTPPALVVFSDYQCPACRVLHDQLREYEQAGSPQFSVLYRHLPLPSHPAAEAAAVASECAAEQGAFARMHKTIFDAQAVLPQAVWPDLARSADVKDVARFAQCVKSDSVLALVRRDAQVALRLGIRATPAVILRGGTQFVGIPPRAVLDSLFGRLAGPVGSAAAGGAAAGGAAR